MSKDLKQRAYEAERSENFDRAIQLYRSVIDNREAEGLTHQDASMFVRIADLHLRRDEEEQAVEAFQRAGELYAREGLQPQAIAIYRRILRIASRHTEALWNLAWLHAEMGVMAEARRYVADYLETVDPETDWGEATDFLRRLLDLSDDTAIGLRLAEIYEEAGEHQEAVEVLDRLDVDVGATSGLDADEVRRRIESVRDGEESDLGAEPERTEARSGSPDRSAAEPGWGEEADDDGEFDIEVGDDEAGALDDAHPFSDDRPREGGEEVDARAEVSETPEQPTDEPEERDRETREETMASETQDPHGGSAAETEHGPEPTVHRTQSDGDGGDRTAPTGSSRDAEGTAAYEEEYGERAELRRGLDVLDELIEIDPDRLAHYRRRIGYAERLDDDDELADSYLQLAERLRSRSSTRAARLVYERLREHGTGEEAARKGIEELDRAARDALGLSDPFADAELSRPDEAEGARSELARRVWPELESLLEQIQWLRGAAERLRAGSGSADDRPPAEAYELAGRYYLSRGDAEAAIETLSLALDGGADEKELTDVHFVLGLSHYRIDDRGSARRYFERVADRDEDFRAVYDWLLSDS